MSAADGTALGRSPAAGWSATSIARAGTVHIGGRREQIAAGRGVGRQGGLADVVAFGRLSIGPDDRGVSLLVGPAGADDQGVEVRGLEFALRERDEGGGGEGRKARGGLPHAGGLRAEAEFVVLATLAEAEVIEAFGLRIG